jgi:hypothetical protein
MLWGHLIKGPLEELLHLPALVLLLEEEEDCSIPLRLDSLLIIPHLLHANIQWFHQTHTGKTEKDVLSIICVAQISSSWNCIKCTKSFMHQARQTYTVCANNFFSSELYNIRIEWITLQWG